MSQATQVPKSAVDPIVRIGAIRRVFRAIRDKANALTRKAYVKKDEDTAEEIRAKIASLMDSSK